MNSITPHVLDPCRLLDSPRMQQQLQLLEVQPINQLCLFPVYVRIVPLSGIRLRLRLRLRLNLLTLISMPRYIAASYRDMQAGVQSLHSYTGFSGQKFIMYSFLLLHGHQIIIMSWINKETK